jgi:hypothetical protein
VERGEELVTKLPDRGRGQNGFCKMALLTGAQSRRKYQRHVKNQHILIGLGVWTRLCGSHHAHNSSHPQPSKVRVTGLQPYAYHLSINQRTRVMVTTNIFSHPPRSGKGFFFFWEVLKRTATMNPMRNRKRRPHGTACVTCKMAHKACDGARPCARCVSLCARVCFMSRSRSPQS